MRRLILLVLFLLFTNLLHAQGYNHAWLLGYGNWINKGRINITNNNLQLSIEQRSMEFYGTQGNISDAYGNFIMSSNGVWIANKNNNLMLNGGGLNPNSFTNDWQDGLPLPNGNLVLPWPDDTTKFILFHQTGTYAPNYNLASSELYYSVIDITGDNGNGEVIQKNTIFFQDTLAWGLTACKHANGRDWWIIAIKAKSNIIFKFLLTPLGVQYNDSQQFLFPVYIAIAAQPTFSPDGNKFAFAAGIGNSSNYWTYNIRILDFDRCTGNFYNPKVIDVTDGIYGYGVAFSPNSKYLYVSKFNKVMQLNTDTTNIAASLDTVAVYDGYISGWPPSCCATDFWLMYLAANGKIYLTSGNGVQHLHYIDNPDLDGVACNVIQHGLDLNGVWHGRSVPVHPNYYLGPVTGSICDSLNVGVNEVEHDFKFSITPNPTKGNVKIIYLLPKNKPGNLEIFDISGRNIFDYYLPQWSTLQQFDLSYLSQGIYAVKISSEGYSATKKIIVMKN